MERRSLLEQTLPIEVTSNTAQKILAAFLCLFCHGFALAQLLFLLLPQQFPSREHFATYTVAQKIPLFAYVLCMLGMGFFLLVDAFRYRLRADERGISQRNGLGTKFAAWSDIRRYSLEEIGRGSMAEIIPILRDVDNNVLLRPVEQKTFPLGNAGERRALFWDVVMHRIDTNRGALPFAASTERSNS